MTISSSLFILDNHSLPRVAGFNALQYVDWSFDIVGNSSLGNLCGFYNYFSATQTYTGGGSFNISGNHPDLPDPTTIQDILDAGPCEVTPEQQIADLIAEISGMGLPSRVTNHLIRTLEKSQRSLESGNPERAVRQLDSLISYIANIASRGIIDWVTADELTVEVQAIIDSISV